MFTWHLQSDNTKRSLKVNDDTSQSNYECLNLASWKSGSVESSLKASWWCLSLLIVSIMFRVYRYWLWLLGEVTTLKKFTKGKWIMFISSNYECLFWHLHEVIALKAIKLCLYLEFAKNIILWLQYLQSDKTESSLKECG